jgi:DNA-binding response OmpR family regulator
VFTREEIAAEVWGGPHLKSSRAMDTHLCRIARKFEAVSGERVVTNVWGDGYKLTATPEKGVEI